MQPITIGAFMNCKISMAQVLEFVEAKLIEQGRPSVNSAGACVYRAAYGAKCAAGWLIPDSQYDAQMDDAAGETSATTIMSKFTEVLGIGVYDRDSTRTAFIKNLQGAHDVAARRALENGENFLRVFKENCNQLRGMYEIS